MVLQGPYSNEIFLKYKYGKFNNVYFTIKCKFWEHKNEVLAYMYTFDGLDTAEMCYLSAIFLFIIFIYTYTELIFHRNKFDIYLKYK